MYIKYNSIRQEALLEAKKNRQKGHLDIQKDSLYSSGYDENLSSGVNTGGATGSIKINLGEDGTAGQRKSSIKSQTVFRQILASGKDNENFNELIGANVAKKLLGPSKDGLERVPTVDLGYSNKQKGPIVVSRYLPGVIGTVADFVRKKTGSTLKRPFISFNHQIEKDKDTLDISTSEYQELRKNIADAVAIRLAVGDDDGHAENLMMFKGGIGSIDFGHAYDNMKSLPKFLGGGRNHNNGILDTLNRRMLNATVGFTVKIGQYKGLKISEELSKSLKNIAEAEDYSIKVKEGLQESKLPLKQLVQDLEKSGNKKQAKHIVDSLLKINENIHGNNIDHKRLNSSEIIDKIYANIEEFHETKRKEMLEVSKIIDLQVKIDKALAKQKYNPNFNLDKIDGLDELQKIYNDVDIKKDKQGKITWVSDGGDVLKGDLKEYIQKRAAKEFKINISKKIDIKPSKGFGIW